MKDAPRLRPRDALSASLLVALLGLSFACSRVDRNQPFASLGIARAQYELGLCYESGIGGAPADYAVAADWFRKAAEQGHHDAQYHLAVLYAEGLGVERDDLEAVRLLNRLIAMGDARAAAYRAWVRRRIVERAQEADEPPPEIAL